jgi:hypothetical protein
MKSYEIIRKQQIEKVIAILTGKQKNEVEQMNTTGYFKTTEQYNKDSYLINAANFTKEAAEKETEEVGIYELLKLSNAIHAIRIFWDSADNRAKKSLIAGLND